MRHCYQALDQIAHGTYPRRTVVSGNWRDDLFEAQLKFVAGSSKRRAALCGRRAGKTEGTGYWFIEGGLEAPNETSVFIALSSGHCMRTLWTSLTRIILRRPELGLKLTQSRGDLICRFPNGHQIWMAGAKNRAEIEKFRGNRYKRVAIDEAGSFGAHLEELVEDVLEPALMDLDGELALTGSPPVLPVGYFWEVTTGANGRPQWPVSHWTVLENPHIPHAAEYLRAKREANGWSEDHPRYRREYLGEWVRDEGAMVFPYDGQRNAYWDLPTGGAWTNVTGMDLGFVDPTAWVTESYRDGYSEVWMRKVYEESGLIPSVVAVKTEAWLRDFPGRCVADTGGQGKPIVEEMRRRYGLGVLPADKKAKRAAIEVMRGDVLSGVLKLHPVECALIIDEWSRLQWDEGHEGFDERCGAHLSDAALYAHRDCRARYREPPPPKPLPGTDAWARQERDRIRARIVADQRRKSLAAMGRPILR